jgi:hypothetical protein
MLSWLISTIGIALLQSLLIWLSCPLAERLSARQRRKRKGCGLWIALQTGLPFLQRRPAVLILKNLFISFRRSRVLSQIVVLVHLLLIAFLLSAFVALGVRNLGRTGEWNAARNVQMFFGGLVLIALPTRAFEFSEEETEWLLRVMPLSGRWLYGAEYLGLCGLCLFGVLLILLPSLMVALFLGGQIFTVLCFVLLGSAFFPLWAMSIKLFVFPRGEFGRGAIQHQCHYRSHVYTHLPSNGAGDALPGLALHAHWHHATRAPCTGDPVSPGRISGGPSSSYTA